MLPPAHLSTGVFGLSKCLKGDIISVLQKQYVTWYHDLSSEMLRGVGKSLIAAVYLAAGLIPSSVIRNPANSTSLPANLNFSELNTRQFLLQWERMLLLGLLIDRLLADLGEVADLAALLALGSVSFADCLSY